VIRKLGVCSWSLRPEGPRGLVNRVKAAGLTAVQLALDPIREKTWKEAETRDALRAGGIAIISGMMGTKGEDYSTLESIRETGGVRMDTTWAENFAAARSNAVIAKRMGITLVTLHAGFLPHDRSDPERGKMIDRLRQVADAFAAEGVRIALETGQESAETLLEVLEDLQRPNVGVNLDPANMILYGMGDPIAAVTKLGGRIVQFHIKDAIASRKPGAWGEEVVVGHGAVKWGQFFEAIKGIPGNLLIEREAGDRRIEDVTTARGVIERETKAQ
jgi:L-ribulose-5-phosphate 3-epimerase